MPRFCTYCGNPLEKEHKYCINCGKPIVIGEFENSKDVKEGFPKAKRESKYILTSGQRNIFLYKVMPIILIGSVIWLISEILFTIIFIEIEFNIVFLIFYICMIIVEVNLITTIYFTAKANKIYLTLLIFFLFSFIAGILSLPIIMITQFLPQVHMFVSLSLGATLITCFVGFILREKYFAKGYLWAHIILFMTGLALLEIAFIFIFTIHNFLLTIPASLAYILIITLTEMFYGAKAVQKSEKDPWVYIFFKIEGMLLLVLIISIGIVIIVLIFIAIAIACGDSNLNLSGLSGGGGKSKRKRKKIN
ncbi:MAG: zinc-ribbon domain-containing protein [Candidatus Thorarchaeota archaeon]